MAKLTTPLLSFAARKSLGNSLTFRTVSRTNILSKKSTPTDPRTQAQQDQRDKIGRAGYFWSTAMHEKIIRDSWRTYAARLRARTPGYQFFVRTTAADPLAPETYYASTINQIRSYPSTSYFWVYLKGINALTAVPNGVYHRVYYGKSPAEYTLFKRGPSQGGTTYMYVSGPLDFPLYFLICDDNDIPISGDMYLTESVY